MPESVRTRPRPFAPFRALSRRSAHALRFGIHAAARLGRARQGLLVLRTFLMDRQIGEVDALFIRRRTPITKGFTI